MTTLKVGGTYVCRHTRKGTFTMRVTHIHGTQPGERWIEGDIVDGKAHMISQPDATMGESINVRESLARWEDVS